MYLERLKQAKPILASTILIIFMTNFLKVPGVELKI